MTASEVLAVTDPKVLFGADVNAAFRALAVRWHPDHCADPQAATVTAHLIALRNRALGKRVAVTLTVPNGSLLVDSGVVTLASGDTDCERAIRVMRGLAPLSDLVKRIPAVTSGTPNSVTMSVPADAVPLSTVQAAYPRGVPQRHVAWIVSRLYEVAALVESVGAIVCCGILPESTLILPVTHGAIPVDWRFAVPTGSVLKSLPAALLPFVPSDKTATSVLDSKAIHRLALILLGDSAGIGNALLPRAKANPDDIDPRFLAWFRETPGADPITLYKAYRAKLVECFGPPKYQTLEI